MNIYETIASKVEDENAKNNRMIAHYDDELNKYSTFVRELYISLEEKEDETAIVVKNMIVDFLWDVIGCKYSDEDNVEIISAREICIDCAKDIIGYISDKQHFCVGVTPLETTGDTPELKCEDYRYKAQKHFIRSMEDYV